MLRESLQLVLVGKDADGDHAPGAAESVHTGGPNGVVNLALFLKWLVTQLNKNNHGYINL